jgi:hypothetical protein
VTAVQRAIDNEQDVSKVSIEILWSSTGIDSFALDVAEDRNIGAWI